MVGVWMVGIWMLDELEGAGGRCCLNNNCIKYQFILLLLKLSKVNKSLFTGIKT